MATRGYCDTHRKDFWGRYCPECREEERFRQQLESEEKTREAIQRKQGETREAYESEIDDLKREIKDEIKDLKREIDDLKKKMETLVRWAKSWYSR